MSKSCQDAPGRSHGYQEITPAGVDPLGEGDARRSYYISIERMRRVFTLSRFHYYNLRTAKDVLENPDEVYRGIRDDREGWGLCFHGVRDTCRSRDDKKQPVPKQGLTFCVFVSEKNVMFDWRFEERKLVACDEAVLLGGVQFRFKEMIWPRQRALRR